MALTAEQRQEIVTDLTTNCDCWKGEGDADILARLPDEKLTLFQRQARAVTVANVAVRGIRSGDKAFRVNPETGKWEQAPVTNAPEEMEGMKKKMMPYPDEEEDEEEEDEEESKKKVTNRKTSSKRPQTTEDIVRSLPPELQSMISNAQQIETREKNTIIEKLLTNVAPSDRAAHHERLMRRSLEDLYNDLALVPKQPSPEELAKTLGTQSNNTRRAARDREDDGEVLVPLAINWQEVGGQEGKETLAANATDADNDSSGIGELSEEEWMRQAPAHIRHAVQNAVAIEGRARRELIEQLVANVTDHDAEQRLRQVLANKSIKELQELIILAPKKETRPTNYFGASAPITNAPRASAGDSGDDLLVPPTMNWAEATPSTNGRH